jgi:glucosamine kinase
MSQYILGIDAGATKVIGRLESIAGDETWTERDGPCSLTNQCQQTIDRLTTLIKRLLSSANVSAQQTTLVCGIAGCAHERSRQALEKAFNEIGLKDYQITSDAITSLYGAGYGEAMISVAIGTGSVAMRLDRDGNLKEFGGWGFKLGDQGSGAYIGRELIKTALPYFDQNNYATDDLLCKVFDVIGRTRSDILDWAGQADPSDYAALAKLLIEYPGHPISKLLLDQATGDIVALINNAQPEQALPVALQGGLARVIGPRLPESIQALLIEARGNAVDGALYMARQQVEKSK